MKGRNPNQRNEEDRAQLILIGGLAVAIAIVAIALVVGGGLFSQSTNDDGGLSSFTSQTTEQVRVAERVGQTNLNYSNVNSTLLKGAYPDELCGELVSSTEVRQLVSAQLGQGDSIVDIEVTSQDCGNSTLEGASWVVGQTNPNYNLPSVNASNSGGRNPVDVVFAIDTTGSMGNAGKLGFTQDGAKAAIEDLKNGEDKIGLVGYSTWEACVDLDYFTDTDFGNFIFDNDPRPEPWINSVTTFCDEFDGGGGSYNFGGAEEVESMNKLTGSHESDLKNGVDSFSAGGGTDITTGLDEAKDVLDSGARSDPDVTQHIVLMTDGEHNRDSENFAPFERDPEDYINANEGDYSDTFVHTVGLTDDLSDIDSGVLEELANKDGTFSSVRPEGTFIQSDNPSDAEDIFEDVVDDIQATTEDTATGEVSEIQDIRMNVSDFQGNGTYLMEFNNGSDVIWQMEVDNKFVAPGNPSPGEGYEVRFRSEVDSSLDGKTIEVSESEGNLSDSDDYVWLDLTGKDDTKPRLDVGGLTTTETTNDLTGYSDPDDYIEDAWNEVRSEVNNGGVNTVLNHTGPNGPSNPPFRRGEVKGTFAIEFQPKDNNFTKIKQITGGNFTEDCDAANASDLPNRCGLNDSGNDRGAVSTTQIDEVVLSVKVESPEGISERRITIPPGNEEFDFDIFDQETK